MQMPDLSDYVTVAERIAQFRERYPDGCLRPVNPDKPWEIITIGDRTFIGYAAAAYRSPEDELPGIGIAWEPFPGRTPYTRDSEAMNAETSSWGRAIIAALAADTKTGLASREEVQNRQGEERKPAPRKPAAPKDEKSTAQGLADLAAMTTDLDSLRGLYEQAGTAGFLNTPVADPQTGEKMALKDYLAQRGAALKAAQ